VKAADCYSSNGIVVTHDTFNRFLTRQSLTPETLWEEVEPYIEKRSGWFVLDDTVIDKIYSKQIELTQLSMERETSQGSPGHRPDHPRLD
jgi:hypothetical protein